MKITIIPKWFYASLMTVCIIGCSKIESTFIVDNPKVEITASEETSKVASTTVTDEILLKRASELNAKCRGASNFDGTEKICQERNQLWSDLKAKGWCYGKDDEPSSQHQWERCSTNTKTEKYSIHTDDIGLVCKKNYGTTKLFVVYSPNNNVQRIYEQKDNEELDYVYQINRIKNKDLSQITLDLTSVFILVTLEMTHDDRSPEKIEGLITFEINRETLKSQFMELQSANLTNYECDLLPDKKFSEIISWQNKIYKKYEEERKSKNKL